MSETLRSLAQRPSPIENVVVVGASEGNLPAGGDFPEGWKFLLSPEKGLTIQRNFGVQHLPRASEFVVFLDDDMEVSTCSLMKSGKY